MFVLGIIVVLLSIALYLLLSFAYGMSDNPQDNSSVTPLRVFSVGAILGSLLIIASYLV